MRRRCQSECECVMGVCCQCKLAYVRRGSVCTWADAVCEDSVRRAERRRCKEGNTTYISKVNAFVSETFRLKTNNGERCASHQRVALEGSRTVIPFCQTLNRLNWINHTGDNEWNKTHTNTHYIEDGIYVTPKLSHLMHDESNVQPGKSVAKSTIASRGSQSKKSKFDVIGSAWCVHFDRPSFLVERIEMNDVNQIEMRDEFHRSKWVYRIRWISSHLPHFLRHIRSTDAKLVFSRKSLATD